MTDRGPGVQALEARLDEGVAEIDRGVDRYVRLVAEVIRQNGYQRAMAVFHTFLRGQDPDMVAGLAAGAVARLAREEARDPERRRRGWRSFGAGVRGRRGGGR